MSRTMTVVLALAWTLAAGSALAAMQKGDTVQLAADTTLKTRPTPDAEALAPAPAGSIATLSVRMSNTSGDWWYVEVGGKKGWLPESALVAAAPVAPAAPEPPAPTEAPASMEAPVAAVAPPAPVAAAPAPTPATRSSMLTAKGSTELALAFEYAKQSDPYFDTTYTTLGLKWGRCTTDRDELGVNVSYVRVSESGSGDPGDEDYSASSYIIGPFYTRNLPSAPSNVVPFFTLSGGVARTESGGLIIKGKVLEVSGGARVFAAPDFSVNLVAYYNKTDQAYEDFGLDTKTFGFRVGVSGFLR